MKTVEQTKLEAKIGALYSEFYTAMAMDAITKRGEVMIELSSVHQQLEDLITDTLTVRSAKAALEAAAWAHNLKS